MQRRKRDLTGRSRHRVMIARTRIRDSKTLKRQIRVENERGDLIQTGLQVKAREVPADRDCLKVAPET